MAKAFLVAVGSVPNEDEIREPSDADERGHSRASDASRRAVRWGVRSLGEEGGRAGGGVPGLVEFGEDGEHAEIVALSTCEWLRVV